MIVPVDFDQISAAAEVLRARVGDFPAIAIVLGSGLNGLAARADDAIAIPYAEIPGFPTPTVAGHRGEMVVGRLGGVRVAMLAGRFHYYEGHDLATVTLPIRVVRAAGASTLILTAATGGIADGLRPGDLVAIADHINMIGSNPLRGPNDDRHGPRFADMTSVYARHSAPWR